MGTLIASFCCIMAILIHCIRMSVNISAYSSIQPSFQAIGPFISPSIRPFVFLSISPPLCLSVHSPVTLQPEAGKSHLLRVCMQHTSSPRHHRGLSLTVTGELESDIFPYAAITWDWYLLETKLKCLILHLCLTNERIV